MFRRFTTSLPERLAALLRRRPAGLVTLELVGPCNLRCSYCLRSESMLYGKAAFLSRERVLKILTAIQRQWAPFSISLTGGEPTLHPEFGGIVADIARLGLPMRLVTNGSRFDRVADDLLGLRGNLRGVAFSLDGADREAHDRWRGAGSFDRVMKAMMTARVKGLPFQVNVVLRRDTLPAMQPIVLLAARLGATGVDFGALLPTTHRDFKTLSLSKAEEDEAAIEAVELSRMFRVQVRMVQRLHKPEPGPHCLPLLERSLNVDHRGRLTLCGNLSFFRNGECEGEVAGPADSETLTRLETLRVFGQQALADRDAALRTCEEEKSGPDEVLSSPCLSCLKHFGKIPWAREATA